MPFSSTKLNDDSSGLDDITTRIIFKSEMIAGIDFPILLPNPASE